MIRATAGAVTQADVHPHRDRPQWDSRHFGIGVVAIVALGAAIRLWYVLSDDVRFVGGDGFAYSIEALRLADGDGYTSYFGGEQSAHHPPGWVTVLAIFARFGGRSLLSQQLFGVAIGLGVIAITALVGRRYFNARVGLLAAVIAALYPGFWVIEAQVLSEPLGLLILGVLTLEVIELRDHPTLRWSGVVGATCGVLALVRSEQLLLMVIVVAPVLLRASSLNMARRFGLLAVTGLVAIVVIAPWTLYNETRFENTVVLSTNAGGTLLAGNCPPSTYSGERLGYYDRTCLQRLSVQEQAQGHDLDRSELEQVARRAAFTNIRENLSELPRTVAARVGRTLAVFRPSQTVQLTAEWFASDTWPVWLWVVSFWFLVPFTIAGTVAARRSGGFVLPLLAPLVITVLVVIVAYGEPRYHTPADLGLVVLAAVAVDRLTRRRAEVAKRR